MVATKEMQIPTLSAPDISERMSCWSTSKNIGILILTLVVLIIVSSICIRYSLTPKTSNVHLQTAATSTASNADVLMYRGK